MAFAFPARPAELAIDVLDIGQGDSILITTPSGRRMLVDTGPDEGRLRKELATVLPPLEKHIDVLLLTHSDKDHIGGAVMVLNDFSVSQLIVNNEATAPEGMAAVLALAEEKHIPLMRADSKQDLQLDPWTLLDILTPAPNYTPAEDDANNHSIVFMLLTPTDHMLFMGDAEEPEEKALLAAGLPLYASWLKGGHHGSKSSTSPEFLEAVRPKTVVFQNGKDNSYGHPAKEVMDRLAAAHIPVYNTSIVGRMHLQCPPEASCILTQQHSDDSS